MSQPSPYYFVAPSDPDGDRFAYSRTGYGHPAPVFVQAAWEWLLERVTRRLVLLKLVGTEHVALNLSERAGMYRVPRLLCLPYSGVGTEASFASADESSLLPYVDSANYFIQRTAYGPASVPGLVAELLELGGADGGYGGHVSGPWFCDPSSWPAAKSADALYVESTAVSEPSHPTTAAAAWECRTSVVHRPYDVASFLPAFRPLGDMRVDESDVRTVPVWDPASGEFADRRMVCPRTRSPRSFDADPGHGELVDVEVGHDWSVPEGERESVEVLVLHGLTDLSRGFAVDCRVNADLGVYEGGEGFAWARRDLSSSGTPCRRDSMRSYVGALASAPAPSRTGVAFSSVNPSFRGKVHPAPDWNGKASCWEDWGLPDLSAVPAGSVYRRQLEAACSARPCMPPAAPRLPASDDSASSPFSRAYPVAPDVDVSAASAVRPPCAASPVNAGLVLDRLRVTVHRVERLYARVEAYSELSQERSGDELHEYSYAPPSGGTWRETVFNSMRVRGTFVGTLRSLFGLGEGYLGLGDGDPDGVNSYHDSHADEDTASSSASWTRGRSDEWGTESASASASARGIVALRSAAGSDGLETAHERRYGYERSGSYLGPRYCDSSSDGWTSGSDSGYVPQDSDLLFHPDVMAWMERAELFAVIRVSSYAQGGDSGSSLGTWTSDSGVQTSSSSRAGSRTSMGRYRVVSLGLMDLSTGEFPDLDVAGLVMDSLPHGGGTGFSHEEGYEFWESSGSSRFTSWSDSSGSGWTDERSDAYPVRYATGVDVCDAYVAVEWKFDTDEPPAPSSGAGGVSRRATAARAALAAAESSLGRASRALGSASSALSSLGSRLAELDAVLSGGSAARAAAVAAARAAASAAASARDDAEDAVSDAEDAVSAAAAAVPSGDSDPAALDAALAALSAAEADLRAAKADLARAEADYRRAAADLADMEAGAAVDQAAAEAALADAEDAEADAEDAVSDAGDLEGPAEAAAASARTALSAAYSSPSAQTAAAAESASSAALSAAGDFADAVSAAQDAVAAAQGACSAAFAAAWGV